MSGGGHIVTFLSAKGGAGKTVTSSSIGRLLAGLDFKILLVDTDAATNGLTLLFLDEITRSKRESSEAVGVFEIEPTGSFKVTPIGKNLDLVPATYRLFQTEGVALEKFAAKLKEIIAQLSTSYDFILLDAQAGGDAYARVSASLAHQVVIVTEFDPISFQGVDRLKILFSEVMDPQNTWILYNKILPEFATAIGEGLLVARVLPPIQWDADVIRAFAQRELAVNFEEPNKYTLSISAIASRLLGGSVKDRVREWLISSREAKKQPILRELEEIEGQITTTEHTAISASFSARREKLRKVTLLMGVGVLVLFSLNTLLNWAFPSVSFVFFLILTSVAVAGILLVIGSSWTSAGEIEALTVQNQLRRRVVDLSEKRKQLKIAVDTIEKLDPAPKPK
jgi:cellulose biosynthesis protein BcsQ